MTTQNEFKINFPSIGLDLSIIRLISNKLIIEKESLSIEDHLINIAELNFCVNELLSKHGNNPNSVELIKRIKMLTDGESHRCKNLKNTTK